MHKLGYISDCGGENSNKYEICIQAKITKNPFLSVSRDTADVLALVHTDICDFKSFTTRGGKKYFITFIDGFSQYYLVYLLRSKDEAFSKFIEF